MVEYISGALGVFALGWALRLEAAHAKLSERADGHEKHDELVHANMTSALGRIEGSQVRLESKVDRLIMRMVPPGD
jgi:hypothetical protein